jgi:hypothetical protein
MLLARRPLDEEDRAGILELIRNQCLGGIHLDAVDNLIDGFPKIADYPPYGVSYTFILLNAQVPTRMNTASNPRRMRRLAW